MFTGPWGSLLVIGLADQWVVLYLYGIDGIVLGWFVSYLPDHKQKVKLMDCLSSPAEVGCGVPKDSSYFHCYLLSTLPPFSYIIQRHNVKHHLEADDT